MIDIQNIEIGHKTPLFSIENLQLIKGEMYILIGANGSGKTTFLQSIIGVLKPFKGEIKINNKSVLSLNRLDRAKTIAFVNSKFDGIDFLRVKDYIALGRTPYTNALGRLLESDWKIVDEVIALLNLEKFQDKFTTELSDGERQMAAIARAITQQTDLIILDEPTAFLDYSNRKKVMELMKFIAVELKKCIIVSSHDLELCLESNASLLVVNKSLKKVLHYEANSIDKQTLIEIGF